MIRPSCDGTSAASFSSWVWTVIRITGVKGTTMCTPDGSTRDETLPKKSSTPTLPAGITTTGLKNMKKNSAASPNSAHRTFPRRGGLISNTCVGIGPPCPAAAGRGSIPGGTHSREHAISRLGFPRRRRGGFREHDLSFFRQIELLGQRSLGHARHAQDLAGDRHDEASAGGELDLAHRDQEVLRASEQGGIVGQRLLGLGDAHRELVVSELLE